MSRTTDLFAAEAELRDAADVYSTWDRAVHDKGRTRKLMNDCRARLRTAAIAYARLARDIDEPAPPSKVTK